jgi:hypothetical protein
MRNLHRYVEALDEAGYTNIVGLRGGYNMVGAVQLSNPVGPRSFHTRGFIREKRRRLWLVPSLHPTATRVAPRVAVSRGPQPLNP